MKTKSFYLFLIILSSLFLVTCKKNNPAEPEDTFEPGRRDYIWKEDTLKTKEPLMITRMWGSSPENVWAIGMSGLTTAVWHFNGIRWSCDSDPKIINPSAIIGFSSNDVWIGNENGAIWKFDGKSWSLFREFKIKDFDNIVIINFCGTARDDIYAVGFADQYHGKDYIGIIIHYDGSDWTLVNFDSTRAGFNNAVIEESSNNLLIEGCNTDKGYIGKLFVLNTKKITEIYSGAEPAVTKINKTIYVTIGQKIYKYEDQKLNLWIDKTGSEFVGKIWGGRSSTDFFWCSIVGIGHYNGIDFKNIYNYDYNLGYGIVFEKDVFFATKDWERTGYNIVIHGKLE